jgi:hypothetical protein
LSKALTRVSAVVIILAIAFTLVLAMPVFAAGGSLNFIKSTPESGGTNVPIENVGIKLFFDGNVTDQSVWAANAKAFTLKDPSGKIIDYSAYPGQKVGEEGYILVVADPPRVSENMPGQLEQKTIFSLTISADLMSKEGALLGDDIIITFETMDVAANSKLSMVIMVLMLVAVMGLMFFTNWRKMKAEAEAAALIKANPYKIAKEKSITVDEAKALIEKAKEKNKKQLEKVGGKAPVPEEKKSVAPRLESKKKKKNTHKVSGPRPISEGGSSYKSGRKAEKERKAKAAVAKKAAASQKKTGAGGSSKKAGSKNKGKKK